MVRQNEEKDLIETDNSTKITQNKEDHRRNTWQRNNARQRTEQTESYKYTEADKGTK